MPLYPGLFTDTSPGLVPASGGGTSNFLRADGSFSAPTATITAPFEGDQAPATSVTIETGKFALHGRRLVLASSERLTIEGTGQLIIMGVTS